MIIFLITIMIMIINNYEDNDNCDNRETGGRHTLIFTSALRWKWNVDRENVIGNGNEWHLNHVFVNVGGSLRMGEYVRMITILHIGVSWDHKFDYGFPLRYLWLLLFEMSLGIIIFDKKAILSNLCHIIWLSLPFIRPEGASSRSVCRTCDRRKTVCTVYSVMASVVIIIIIIIIIIITVINITANIINNIIEIKIVTKIRFDHM